MKNYKQNFSYTRYLNPSDIYIKKGYSINIFATGLDSPCCILFSNAGDMLIGCSGENSGNPCVLQNVYGHFETIAEQFHVPLTGININNKGLYVSHKGTITVLNWDGSRIDILSGLPCFGDYPNGRVSFDWNGKMYFGLGTATNSGVVGNDNKWVLSHPLACDNPGNYIILNRQNFETSNMFTKNVGEKILTGGFSLTAARTLPLKPEKP